MGLFNSTKRQTKKMIDQLKYVDIPETKRAIQRTTNDDARSKLEDILFEQESMLTSLELDLEIDKLF